MFPQIKYKIFCRQVDSTRIIVKLNEYHHGILYIRQCMRHFQICLRVRLSLMEFLMNFSYFIVEEIFKYYFYTPKFVSMIPNQTGIN